MVWLWTVLIHHRTAPLLHAVWRDVRGALAATSLVACVVWVSSTTLWYAVERSKLSWMQNGLPQALYHTVFFLHGEWPSADFHSPFGKAMALAYCLFGTA